MLKGNCCIIVFKKLSRHHSQFSVKSQHNAKETHKKAYLLLCVHFIDQSDTRLLHAVLLSTLRRKGEGEKKIMGTGEDTGYSLLQMLRKFHLLRPHFVHFFKTRNKVNYTEDEHFHLVKIFLLYS